MVPVAIQPCGSFSTPVCQSWLLAVAAASCTALLSSRVAESQPRSLGEPCTIQGRPRAVQCLDRSLDGFVTAARAFCWAVRTVDACGEVAQVAWHAWSSASPPVSCGPPQWAVVGEPASDPGFSDPELPGEACSSWSGECPEPEPHLTDSRYFIAAAGEQIF